MNKEMFNELFKDVVVSGHYPLEKLHEMDWYIRSLNDKIKTLNNQLDKELIKRARLEDRINKACEYIEKDLGYLARDDYSKLIGILKGDKEKI